MATIPLIEGSRAAYPGATIDPSAARARSAGLAQFGAALSDVGDAGMDVALRMQHADDVASMADVDRQANEAFEQWKLDSQKPEFEDEKRWSEEWGKRSKALRDGVAQNTQVSAKARRALDVRLKDWESQTGIAVAGEAQKRGIARNRAKLVNAAEWNYRMGNLEQAEATIDQAVSVGVMFPEDGEDLKRKGKATVDMQQATRGVMEFPVATLEVLEETDSEGNYKNWTHLDELQRASLTNKARVQWGVQREETVRGFQDRINQGEALSTRELQSAVDAKQITPQQMKWLARQSSGEATSTENNVRAAQLSKRISEWSPTMKDAQLELHNIGSDMAGLPESIQGPLRTKLMNRAEGDYRSDKTRLSERFIDEMVDAGRFGNVRMQGADDEAPGMPVNAKEFDEAETMRLTLKAELDRFVAAHPNASAEEQQEHIRRVSRQKPLTRSSQMILDSMSGRSP